MQFKVFEPGIEVSGTLLGAIVDGFRKYPTVAHKYFSKYGLVKTTTAGQLPQVDVSAWYPLEDCLLACEEISKEIGINSLYGIGKSVPQNAVFPPHVKDVHSAIASIDVAFHMNHRKKGEIMFDLKTGAMLEGIGHYKYEPVPNENRIVCVGENPYPCEFDRGLVSAMAARFDALARTAHDNEAPCRKNGADACTYVVWW